MKKLVRAMRFAVYKHRLQRRKNFYEKSNIHKSDVLLQDYITEMKLVK